MDVRIQTTSMSYRIPLTRYGYIPGIDFYVGDYIEKFSKWQFDFRTRRRYRTSRFVYYHKTKEMLYLPKFDLQNFIDHLSVHGYTAEVEELAPYPGIPVSIPMKPMWTDRTEWQTEIIDAVLKSEEHIRGLGLQPGGGKTFCIIRILSALGIRPMISVGGLADQWTGEFLKYTLLEESDVYLIKGSASIAKLILNIDEINPSVIVASANTLRGYCNDDETYKDFPDFDTLMELLGVGIRVVDEAHLDFLLNMMLDLRLNTPLTLVASATFGRNDRDEKMLYEQHYPKPIRYGDHLYKKYVDIRAYGYSLPGIPTKAYMKARGYLQSGFENYLVNKSKTLLVAFFEYALAPVVDGDYINIRNEGERCLILCKTKELCAQLVTLLKLRYPKDKIDRYVGDSPDSVLTECDIIVATTKRAGTGRDIKQLRTCICLESTGADGLNEQILGRLRELMGTTPRFAYLYNRCIQRQVDHHNSRQVVLGNRSLTFTNINLS